MTAHDCTVAGCEGPALRAHTEAVAQGLPAIATVDGHPDPEGVLRAIRGTATLLRSLSVAPPVPTRVQPTPPGSEATGTGGGAFGDQGRNGHGRSTRSSAPNRETTTTPAVKARVVEERADSPAQRAV